MSTDVRNAHGAGVAAIQGWAAGERAKIGAAHAHTIASDAAVHALTSEFKSLEVADSLPGKFLGQPLLIRNYHGKNLQMDDHGHLNHSPNAGGWELFVLEDSGDHTHFFITSTTQTEGGKPRRLQGRDDKSVATHTNGGGWESWTVADAGGGKFHLVSHFGSQLSQDDHGKTSLSPNKAGWEQFELQIVGGGKAARRAEVEPRLRAAEAHARASADATAAAATAALEAEVGRRIAAKNELAARLDREIAQLAAF